MFLHIHATLDYKCAIGEQLQRAIAGPMVDLSRDCDSNILLCKLLTFIDPKFGNAFNTFCLLWSWEGLLGKHVRPIIFFFPLEKKSFSTNF